MKVKYGRMSDRIINIITWLTIIGMFVFLIVSWKSMPDQVPSHFNAAGEITAYGKKAGALVVPIMALLVCGMITLFEFIPTVWNIPMNDVASNADHVYAMSRNLISFTKLFIVVLCGYLNYVTVKGQPMSRYFLPVILILIAGNTVFWVARMLIKR